MMDLATSLINALEARPFEKLGFQVNKDQLVIRAWFPHANAIELIRKKDGKSLGHMASLSEGLFEFPLPDSTRFTYELRINLNGEEFDYLDPYQFSEASFEDVWCESHDLYKNMGAHPKTITTLDGIEISGTRFTVYAPNARSISVIGDFCHWDGRKTPMASNDDSIWRLFLPNVTVGDRYKFELKDKNGELLPHRADPYGFHHDQYPSFASRVFDQSEYQWNDKAWTDRQQGDLRQLPMNTYELHIASWKQDEQGNVSFRQLAEQLIPYLKEMHYTHVELLPPSEHPFDGSWGYQPIGLFAPSSRFGNPDDFKYFVDQCHQNGLSVIVDWVPAHFPADSHGLAKFDGTALYEYEDPRRGWHPDWNSYIYDYGRETVCNFLISSAMCWLEYFHIDGIRVDAVASMLHLDYSREDGEWIPNVDGGNKNYEAIHFLRRFNETTYKYFPKSFTIAEESTSFPKVSRPTYEGGLGFGFKWNMGWMNDSLEYFSKDPVHRPYHQGDLTFSLIYAFDENFVLPLSHDEVVHGKGSIMTKMPGDEWQQTANLRAYFAFMFAHPGKKLNFMGNEFGQSHEWKYKSSLDWWLLQYPKHQGIQKTHQKLGELYKTLPALHQLDCQPEGFSWINHSDNERCIISFARFDQDKKQTVIVICNLTPQPQPDFRVGLPRNGNYELIFNSDAKEFWGSEFEVNTQLISEAKEWDGFKHSAGVSLPPLSTVMFKLDR
jgi:1,4-alpha-glucan branching enzyme